VGAFETDNNLACSELNAGREICKSLVKNGGGCFDGNAGLPGCAESIEGVGETVTPLAFKGSSVPGRQLPQVGDQPITICKTVGADLERHARSEDLLGPAAADAEEAFYGGTVNPRVGQGSEIREDLI